MADFFGGMGGMFGGVLSSLKYVLYLSPVAVLILILAVHFRNKSIYKYPVRIFKTRENNKVIELNCKGGYIGRKNSAPFFRIKTGKWWWQYIDMNKTPNPKYLDEQDRVYYRQIDVDTFVQMRRKFENGNVKFSPIEPDIKYGAILSIQRIKDVLRTEPTWKKVLPYFGLILMAIVFIVAYAMLMDKCSV